MAKGKGKGGASKVPSKVAEQRENAQAQAAARQKFETGTAAVGETAADGETVVGGGERLTLAQRLEKIRADHAAILAEAESRVAGEFLRDAHRSLGIYIEDSKDETLKTLWSDFAQAEKAAKAGGFATQPQSNGKARGGAGAAAIAKGDELTPDKMDAAQLGAAIQIVYQTVDKAGGELVTTNDLTAAVRESFPKFKGLAELLRTEVQEGGLVTEGISRGTKYKRGKKH